MKFCAICTQETTELVSRPLGRNDAMVLVCVDCEVEPARVDDGPDRNYEPTGGLLSVPESSRGMRAALGADYERIAALDEEFVIPPSERKTDSDFVMLQFDQETSRRIRTGANRRRRA